MGLPITQNPPLKPLPTKRVVVANYREGQITQYENDKIPFSASSVINNLILWKDNLETRPGSLALSETTGIIGLGKADTSGNAKLIQFRIDGATKQISIIDRDSGVADPYTASNLLAGVDWTNGNSLMYWSYGTGVDSFKPSDGTIATVAGATGSLLTYAENRLWAAGAGLKYSTIGVAEHIGDAFNNDMGAYDATTGRYPWGVSHGGTVQTGDMLSFTALVSIGKRVIIFSENQLQAHELPDADFATFIDEERTTLQFERSYGVKSKDAVKVIGQYVYFVNDDGFFRLNPKSGEIKSLNKNIAQHQSFSWEFASLGFNKEWNAVMLSCKNNGANDTTILYFIDYDAFSFFTNLQPRYWVELEDDMYFSNSTATKIVSAFPQDVWLDEGIPIEYNVTTAAIDGKLPEFFKKTRELFADIASEGATTVYIDMYHDRLFGGAKPATTTFEIEFTANPISYGTYAGHPMGDAPLGMSVILNRDGLTEKKLRFKNRAKFGHVELSFRGSCTRKVSIRRFVLTYQETPKKIKNMVLDQ